jgi:hypothetical protein
VAVDRCSSLVLEGEASWDNVCSKPCVLESFELISRLIKDTGNTSGLLSSCRARQTTSAWFSLLQWALLWCSQGDVDYHVRGCSLVDTYLMGRRGEQHDQPPGGATLPGQLCSNCHTCCVLAAGHGGISGQHMPPDFCCLIGCIREACVGAIRVYLLR